MILDERIEGSRIRQFSSQVKELKNETKIQLQQMISGGESEEFYRGLLAGLAASTAFIQSGNAVYVPACVAIVAEHCERMEIA